VVQRNLRLNVEADSLNSAVLGLDAKPGTEEFDLFVREVVREMTAKAGQKCTAIRRAFVPASTCRRHRGAARGARRDDGRRPAGPSDPDGRPGQHRPARRRPRGVGRLAGGGEIVSGDPDAVVDGYERGAFLQPLLLRYDDARYPAVHDVEAFGPVATLLPYDSAAEVVELMALGQGSLVGSVVSHDPAFVREVVLGAAGHHGRLHVLDRDSAGESTGHGSPLPHLVHGGPGRAGGARSSAACAGCGTSCSAPPCRGRRTCSRRSPASTRRARRGWRPRSTPSASR
jgi:oxepin-CoA hydrolase/3-oxo-5,6-dehydrosuberyl-CoA semialdehyde dehydrogenase